MRNLFKVNQNNITDAVLASVLLQNSKNSDFFVLNPYISSITEFEQTENYGGINFHDLLTTKYRIVLMVIRLSFSYGSATRLERGVSQVVSMV